MNMHSPSQRPAARPSCWHLSQIPLLMSKTCSPRLTGFFFQEAATVKAQIKEYIDLMLHGIAEGEQS